MAVITGGNNGIGLESVKGLAKRGWKVIFGSRDEAKNAELVTALRKDGVVGFRLDLSSSTSVEEFAGKVRQEVAHIDVLLNNAGIMALPERRMSVDQREMQFAVNHLGHFQLTYLLFDLLKKSPEGRVINVSSSAHYRCSALIVKDLPAATEYSSVDRYSASKLCNVLFTCKLNRLCEERGLGVRSYSLHPGVVDTGLADNNGCAKCIWILICCCTKTPEEGARCNLHLSLAPKEALRPGEFYDSDTLWKEMNPLGRDQALQNELWLLSERLLQIKFDPS